MLFAALIIEAMLWNELDLLGTVVAKIFTDSQNIWNVPLTVNHMRFPIGNSSGTGTQRPRNASCLSVVSFNSTKS